MSRREQRGLSMIELLVALAIGSVLIAGAVYVYTQSRNTNAVSDAIARLQENGRYALSVIEPDIQMAGYYGFTNSAGDVGFISGGSTGSVIDSEQMKPTNGAVSGLAASAHNCGNNYAVNLTQTIQGANNQTSFALSCAVPTAGGAVRTNTDLLTIRRASTPPATGVIAPEAGRMQLLISRLSPSNQYLFADGTLPATPALDVNNVQVRNLVVRSYYIATDSVNQTGLPALRVKVLSNSGGSPTFVDDPATDNTSGEVMSGVEDLQVQFGIDTGDYDADGTIDAGLDEDGDGIPNYPRGIATRYVNANFTNLNRYQVVAVRLWLMMRAPQAEVGFRDTRTYTYGDRTVTPNDGFRRVLISKTIQLRNARTF